ncbi:histidine phosphotransferase ChpT [Albidovulum inexpectatum]|uniref:Histidine phosphotransferase ChpT n=1 Tax=Albidovulum inexpectatum TaxID=196587 RepID=A0A2S5JIN3_9RHOB|nr:histidine phosphotransferase family protein [Albidovulum inexpectatum]PPB81333.1 histidine phosphotransferase ChpT [Albidovulum inexpectatum]
MTRISADDLAALVGSRICHDLVSPLGAIGNGIELLALTGGGGPEMGLVAQSVAQANARLRFFRIAFGKSEGSQPVPRNEIRTILSEMTEGGRIRVSWNVDDSPSRAEAKLTFLAIQCLETALPMGGQITVSRPSATGWQLEARSDRLKFDRQLWARLTGDPDDGIGQQQISAAQVQFILLPLEAARMNRRLRLDTAEDKLAISF